MKQVLAVRVGAKKAVGHIVSKKWGPTVRCPCGFLAVCFVWLLFCLFWLVACVVGCVTP